MIIQKCDICKKKSDNIQTIILHKKVIDYCPKCRIRAEQILNEFKRVRQQEYLLYEMSLREVEKDFYKEFIEGVTNENTKNNK